MNENHKSMLSADSILRKSTIKGLSYRPEYEAYNNPILKGSF